MPRDCCALLVNFHCAPDIGAAVDCLLEDPVVRRIVVVDNSDDADEHQRLVERVGAVSKVLRAPTNLGFGRACNWAFDMTHEPLVLLVNPDVRLQRGAVAALRATMEAQAVAAAAPRQFLDTECVWRLPPAWAPTALGAWVYARARVDLRAQHRLMGAWRREALRYWTAIAPMRQRALSGGAMMIRRGALLHGESLFDPRFFMYFEDSDLCTRLRRRGGHLMMVPEARAVHAWHDGPHKGPQMAQAAQQFFDKYWPAPNRWRSQTQVCIEQPGAEVSWHDLERAPRDEFERPTWVELSPDRHFLPSIGRFVEPGECFSWENCPWDRFPKHAPVYVRIGLSTDRTPAQVACRQEDLGGHIKWTAI